MTSLPPLEPASASAAWPDDPAWAAPSGSHQHLAGLWRGEALIGAVRLLPSRRARRSHVGDVSVRASDPEAAEELLRGVAEFADAWTPLDRLSLALPADHPAAAVAIRAGFEPEVRRVERFGPGRDEIAFARLRPGFVARAPGPAPTWPARHRRAPAVEVRLVREGDSAAIRDLSIDPGVAWGTLQTPWSNEAFYAERFRATTPDNDVYVVVADGEVAANGGLHPTSHPGVLGLGMGVADRWQGCGLGGRLLDQLIARARERGARRLELGVWVDNDRARALYVSRGFAPEGTLRCDGVRAGGHADSLEMALFL